MSIARLFRLFFLAIVLPIAAVWVLYQFKYVRRYNFRIDENISINVVAKDCMTCFSSKPVDNKIEIKNGDKELDIDFNSQGPVVEFLIDSSRRLLIENPPFHYIFISLDSMIKTNEEPNSFDPIEKTRFRLLYRIEPVVIPANTLPQ